MLFIYSSFASMNIGIGWQISPVRALAPVARDMPAIKRLLVRGSFVNLLLVACLGVLLRAMPFVSSFPLSYKNILHGHSHLAFGGWMMPVLLLLILFAFQKLAEKIHVSHWRNISLLLLISAFGMMITFPLMGYNAVSIFFSTLSILAGFYMAHVIRKATPKKTSYASLLFLRAGLFYLVLSAIGPFATGPLIAMGKSGSDLYYNAIYFYLHFQYNGWFTFAVLAVLYEMIEKRGGGKNGILAFWLLHIACVPAFLLSVLWTQPPVTVNVLGGLAALLQLLAVYFVLKDLSRLPWKNRLADKIILLSAGAFVIKNGLQFAGAFPSVAALAAEYRNFVIAYLHMVLLGFVSLFAFGALLKFCRVPVTIGLKMGFRFFLFAFFITELLLVLQALGGWLNFPIPHFSMLLFLFSCLLPVGIVMIGRRITNGLTADLKQGNKSFSL